MTTIIHLYR